MSHKNNEHYGTRCLRNIKETQLNHLTN
uniref:Uncharacterized protein n=1 Tax=Anguilla anguilla TaxID=7936 RepID=A0A0E9Q0J9_ANGAN